MRYQRDSSAALVNEGDGTHEHDHVVDGTVQVQRRCYAVHQLVFNLVQGLRLVLESKGLMLRVDQGLPAPVWQARLLLARQLEMVVLQLILDLVVVEVLQLFEAFDALYVLLVCHGVLDCLQRIVPKEHGEQYLVGLVLYHVVSDIKDLDRVVES